MTLLQTMECLPEASRLPLVRLLIRAGADVNQRGSSNSGKLPLYTAIQCQCEALVTCLLLAGADPEAECRGSTPLHAAVARSLPRVVALLLAAGADPSATSTLSAVPPLLQAVQVRDSDSALLLLAAGARLRESAAHCRLLACDADALAVAQKQILSTGFRAIRWRLVEICVAVHELWLPAPLLVEIVECACAPFATNLPFHCLWDAVVCVKHFHERQVNNVWQSGSACFKW